MPDPLTSLIVALAIGAVLALTFWPDQGLFWRWRRAQKINEQVLTEDALKQIYESEVAGRGATRRLVGSALKLTEQRTTALLAQMKARELVRSDADPITLTPRGAQQALHIIRAHRLWERFLSEETGYSESEWHGLAHQQEHLLTPAEVEALADRLNNPTHDPHGHPIPTADGLLLAPEGRSLTDLTAGEAGRITHLQDEPAAVYAQLVAEGLAPGMSLRVLESDAQRIRFWADGDEHVLAPMLAGNIGIARLTSADQTDRGEPGQRLSALRPGQRAVVTGISHACRGNERRRFLDLGIVPGTEIEAALPSPSGNPIAYRIRGALIALRHDQAAYIQIASPGEVSS